MSYSRSSARSDLKIFTFPLASYNFRMRAICDVSDIRTFLRLILMAHSGLPITDRTLNPRPRPLKSAVRGSGNPPTLPPAMRECQHDLDRADLARSTHRTRRPPAHGRPLGPQPRGEGRFVSRRHGLAHAREEPSR